MYGYDDEAYAAQTMLHTYQTGWDVGSPEYLNGFWDTAAAVASFALPEGGTNLNLFGNKQAQREHTRELELLAAQGELEEKRAQAQMDQLKLVLGVFTGVGVVGLLLWKGPDIVKAVRR
jgi:hypothetical protein